MPTVGYVRVRVRFFRGFERLKIDGVGENKYNPSRV